MTKRSSVYLYVAWIFCTLAVTAYLTFTLFNTVNDVRARSTAIELGHRGAKLTFEVVWGWGMEQSLTTSTGSSVIADNKTEVVWKKPYNAGGTVYRNVSKDVYFVYLYSGIFRIDLSSLRIERSCDPKVINGLEFVSNFYLDMGTLRQTRGEDVAFSDAPDFKQQWSQHSSPCG